MKPGFHFGFILGVVVLFLLRVAGAVTPENVGLYLSFEERLVVSLAIAEYGETPEVRYSLRSAAKNYAEKFAAKPVSHVKVRNFNEFLSLYRGDWPETHSLRLDLQMILSNPPRGMVQFKAESPRVQRQIDRYLAWKYSQMPRQFSQFKDEVTSAGKNVFHDFANQKTENLNLDASVELQIKKIDEVGKYMADGPLKSVTDPATRISMEVILAGYFSNMSLSSKKLILSSFAGDNLLMSDLRRFELMVQNSGPQFQKLLQVITRKKGLSEDLKNVFKVLEDAVRKVPWQQVQEILEPEKGNYDFRYFERKPLGVGTMAQVHRAKIFKNGVLNNVVVRFIKPGMSERIEEDRQILAKVTKDLDARVDYRATGAPPLSPVVSDLAKTVEAELDQEATKKRQIQGKAYTRRETIADSNYHNYLDIDVPDIIVSEGESKLMVQEMIFGRKLDKEAQAFKDIAPNLKKMVAEKIAHVWLEEAFFRSGYYHADLHQGNFLVQVHDASIRLNILDFGMGGILSKELQAKTILLSFGATAESAAILAKALYNLSDSQKTFTQDQLQTWVQERIEVRKLQGESPLDMSMWSAWAIERGIRLPYDFINLNRGYVILETLLQDSGSPLTMDQISQKLASSYPLSILHKLTRIEKVPKRVLIKTGWQQLIEKLPALPKLSFSKGPSCKGLFLANP